MVVTKKLILKFIFIFWAYCIVLKNINFSIYPRFFFFIFDFFNIHSIIDFIIIDSLYCSLKVTLGYLLSIFLISLFYKSGLITKAEGLDPPNKELIQLSQTLVDNKRLFKAYFLFYVISVIIILFLYFYYFFPSEELQYLKLMPNKHKYSDYMIKPGDYFVSVSVLEYILYFNLLMLVLMFHLLFSQLNFIFLPIKKHLWRLN
jgi:hypothetical protein